MDLKKTVLEDCGLIVSVPCYHLIANEYFISINDRMNHLIIRDPGLLKKTRVGAIISVANSAKDWTTLSLSTINILVQHTRVLVDQIEVHQALMRGAVVRHKKAMERAKELERNVARAMDMPIEEVKYLGEETAVSCPVCHCKILRVPQDLPEVVCPVCWVHGVISLDGGKMKVKWNEENAKHPRFSYRRDKEHLDYTDSRFAEERQILAQDEIKKLIRKYSAYGNIISP